MDNIIERNKTLQKNKHTNELLKSHQSDARHKKNLIEERKRLEEKAEKSEEKIFHKYMTFYFFRKGREKQMKIKSFQANTKFMEKAEKLEEIERKKDLKTKELAKKFYEIEKRKQEILKHKNDDIKKFNKKRKEYFKNCMERRKNQLKELDDIRLDILDYQTCVLNRNIDKTKLINLKRIQSREKTINDQLNFQKNIIPFFKKLEVIKSECVMRKSVNNRRKIYVEKKRREAELRKKEEEEKLLKSL